MNIRSSPGLTTAQAQAVKPPVQNSTPTAGQTVQITDNNLNGLLIVSPAGTLATLTINFPSDANSDIGQIERIVFQKTITLLTLANATVLGAVTSAALGDNIAYQKTAANTWSRMS